MSPVVLCLICALCPKYMICGSISLDSWHKICFKKKKHYHPPFLGNQPKQLTTSSWRCLSKMTTVSSAVVGVVITTILPFLFIFVSFSEVDQQVHCFLCSLDCWFLVFLYRYLASVYMDVVVIISFTEPCSMTYTSWLKCLIFLVASGVLSKTVKRWPNAICGSCTNDMCKFEK